MPSNVEKTKQRTKKEKSLYWKYYHFSLGHFDRFFPSCASAELDGSLHFIGNFGLKPPTKVTPKCERQATFDLSHLRLDTNRISPVQKRSRPERVVVMTDHSCWWWHSWVVPPLVCSTDVWGGGLTEPLCSSSDKHDCVWFMISNDGLGSCQRAHTYLHWSALSAAPASLIHPLFCTKGFTGFVLSEWHRCKASIKWKASAESREKHGFKRRKRRKRICCMSKFGLKALRESVLRQKSHIMEPWSCISGEQRSQTHPDARVCVGCVFLFVGFCDFFWNAVMLAK